MIYLISTETRKKKKELIDESFETMKWQMGLVEKKHHKSEYP